MAGFFLHNARIVDGKGGNALRDGAVLISDNSISWVGERSKAPDIGDARTVDLRDNTVCPGFFDCHVHFALPGGAGNPYRSVAEPASYRTLAVAERLRVTLHNGVTSARDLMGIDAGVRMAVAQGLVEGPRLQVAITMLSQTAGHADLTQLSGFDPMSYLHGPETPSPLVDSVDEARKRTRRLIALGADLVKVASSGGVASPNDQPDWLGMRTELVRAVVEECRAYGNKPVAAHAIGYAGIAAAIDGGVRSVEHGYELDDELRKRMVDQDMFLVPTLLETVEDLDPAKTSPAAYAKSLTWHRVAHEAVGRSAAAGVRIAVGTDAGLSPDHGTNLRELGLLVKYGGLTPMEAIVAATRDSAVLCGVDDRLGTLESGKLADLVVVRGDPLHDIDSVGDPDNILLVVKDGDICRDRGGFFAADR
ncbi:metal-dependent hydrolase family protein [Nocardia arizonensis]|uniref:metal-dependent hydrolase family protein n=1 Tax=Nocardia arizonensis TaxID=1141647 RepID=UPI0006D12CBC|nr:amidohydrolase family protein [Nocardia arizonensis]